MVVDDYMKSNEVIRRQFSNNDQSWFSKKYACWTNNHRGWQKMKKKNKKIFKKRFHRETEIEIEKELNEWHI